MQRIVQPGKAEQTVNKSRFIGVAEYCGNEGELAALFRRLIAEHPNAHHLAYAYRVKTPQGMVQRFHDAGEPAGTAGKPILQHLEGRQLINACIAVVRYYGGINLGTGGLTRAYGNTARLALDAARLEPYVEMQRLRVTLNYGRLDSFVRELERLGGRVVDKRFDEQVALLAEAPAAAVAGLQERFGTDQGHR